MTRGDAVSCTGPRSPATVPAWLSGWGGGPRSVSQVISPTTVGELQLAVRAASDRPMIPRGMGRSYGDAARCGDGIVLDIRGLREVTLDEQRGVVRAAAGVTLGQLVAMLAPLGWMPPVLPGTQHVTVGGAIAADVHGKNHASAGTFGAHVWSLRIIGADGELHTLGPDADGEWFWATIGGMGLTGIVVDAEIALRRLGTDAVLAVETARAHDLGSALRRLSAPGGPHRVAWLDLLHRPGVRGIVTRAEITSGRAAWRELAVRRTATADGLARVPPRWPGGLLRPATVRAYNFHRFRSADERLTRRPEPFGAHMFPLDALDAWPRLYGPAGLLQYQLAVPTAATDALTAIVERVRAATAPCYLAVLKDLGPQNDAPLSFPMQGWTLALDFPRAAVGLDALLATLDELVIGAGGRVYLAKDARLARRAVAAMYPRLDAWRTVRERVDPDGRWSSDLAARTGLVS